MELIRYLHLNPARAALASEPGDYRWSSHRDYLRGKSAIGFAMERRLELWGATRRQARKVEGISLTAAAKVLRRDLSTMSLALKTLEDELRNDSHQRQRLEGFRAQLRKERRRKYQTSKA